MALLKPEFMPKLWQSVNIYRMGGGWLYVNGVKPDTIIKTNNVYTTYIDRIHRIIYVCVYAMAMMAMAMSVC